MQKTVFGVRKAAVSTGLFFLLFSLVYYFYLIPQYIVFSLPPEGISRTSLQPHFLPRIVIVLFALMSIFLIVGALRQQEEEREAVVGARALFQVGVVFALSCVYVYAQELVGFSVSTPFFLAVLIMFFGTRDWRYVVPFSVLFPLGINYFFWFGLQVILPEGTLW